LTKTSIVNLTITADLRQHHWHLWLHWTSCFI